MIKVINLFNLIIVVMRSLAIIVALFLVAVSCGKKESDTETKDAFDYARSSFFNSLRTPSIAADQLRLIAPAFNPIHMSDPANFPIYASDEVKAAANMGIYLSDLNYCVAYQQRDLTGKYFMAAQELSKAIGVDHTLANFILKRYNDNLANNDSVRQVVLDFLNQSTGGQQGTEKERLVGISMGAYQIENLHLALGILDMEPQDSVVLAPLSRLVISQRPNIETIYLFLKANSDVLDPQKSSNYIYYAKAFQELIGYYMVLESDLKADGGSERLSPAQLKELTEKVDAIRSRIVSIE